MVRRLARLSGERLAGLVLAPLNAILAITLALGVWGAVAEGARTDAIGFGAVGILAVANTVAGIWMLARR